MKKRYWALGIGMALVVLALASEFARQLLTGWSFFLQRVVPEIHPDRPTVLVSVCALLLFMVGIHWLLWSWRRRSQAGGPSWKWRWTAAITALVFLLFAAGTAMIGIVHQTGWIASSPEPMYVETARYEYWSDRRSRQNLQYHGLGALNRADTYGTLPAGGTIAADGTMLHGWELDMLDFVGYSTRDFDRTLPWNDPKNASFFKSAIPEFFNSELRGAPVFEEHGFGLNHYSANSHVFRATQPKNLTSTSSGMKLDEITDGTSTTILFGEVSANFSPWGRPMNVRDPAKGINRSPNGFGGPPSRHGANFAMADGSVRFVSEKVSFGVMRALATPNAGDEVEESVLQAAR